MTKSVSGNLVAFYNRIVNALSFGTDYQKLRRLLNMRIDSPESIDEIPVSHPGGFIRDFKKRRITIVDSYLIILRYLESEHHKERIRALKLLEEQTTHAKNLTMPLNTARVQLALMKEAIKNRENKRRQLELLEDFTISSYGRPSVIRKYLDELGFVELPETGQRLSELHGGWDSHVHDNSSYGRKTPSQLVIDAFIKGISEITVGFNFLNSRDNIVEILEAGAILGVRVNIGVEFSALADGKRFHFMFLLPRITNSDELSAFLESNRAALKPLIAGLQTNQLNRIKSIRTLVDSFNSLFLPELNEGYEESSAYYFPPLSMTEMDEIVPLENLNRMHLGEFLYTKFKPVLLRRVILAKSRLNNAQDQFSRREISQWDFSNIQAKYAEIRASYVELNPEELRERYFSNPQLSDYPTVFTDPEALCTRLRKTGGSIKILHPLEHGLGRAYQVILTNAAWIDFVEVYNMHDSINRSIDDILRLARFVNVLNGGKLEAVTPFLEGHTLGFSDEFLAQAVRSISTKPLVPVCGSDSTGRSTTIPGMGFIFDSELTGRMRKRYLDRHFELPEFVSRIIERGGAFVAPADETLPCNYIISMGKSTKFQPNKVGDEHDLSPIPLDRAVRYLNSTLKNFIIAAIGFVVAFLTVGIWFAVAWYAITALRNVIVDLLAGRGARLKEWSWKAIDFRYMSQSLFWTGVSVPILAFIKAQFDVVWPLQASGILHSFAKFFVIALANGLYLVAHNSLRGFGKNVIRVNFFRSILSWPLASLVGPLGDLLAIPSIVQAKFWSDVVAGFIEGSGKFMRAVRLTHRDLSEIIPLSCTQEQDDRRYPAILDLLYIFERQPRARNSLRELFFGKPNPLDRAGQLLRGERTTALFDAEYRVLLAWFEHSSNYQKLADFIISRYDNEWALMLIDLVARQFERFGQWLRDEARAAGAGSQSTAPSAAEAQPAPPATQSESVARPGVVEAPK